EPLPAVTPHCGSNIVTGQALALALPGFTGIVALLFHLPGALVLLMLAADVAAFLRWRTPLGNWVQERYALAADIAWAEIQAIEPLRGGTFFVRTRVEPWRLDSEVT